jgi:hypothetical protein
MRMELCEEATHPRIPQESENFEIDNAKATMMS